MNDNLQPLETSHVSQTAYVPKTFSVTAIVGNCNDNFLKCYKEVNANEIINAVFVKKSKTFLPIKCSEQTTMPSYDGKALKPSSISVKNINVPIYDFDSDYVLKYNTLECSGGGGKNATKDVRNVFEDVPGKRENVGHTKNTAFYMKMPCFGHRKQILHQLSHL
jgi:hypothetical protein